MRDTWDVYRILSGKPLGNHARERSKRLLVDVTDQGSFSVVGFGIMGVVPVLPRRIRRPLLLHEFGTYVKGSPGRKRVPPLEVM
jgi:hypothetical protein